jgi:hypothetical protein
VISLCLHHSALVDCAGGGTCVSVVVELSEQGMTFDQVALQIIKDLEITRVTEGPKHRLAEIVGKCAATKSSVRKGSER